MKDTKKELTELLGYPATRELKTKILQEAKETGKSVEEIAGLYSMPEIFISDEDGTIVYKNERMTPEEFRRRFPFRKFVVH